ncbi:phosphotransferase [Streptomyces sp. GC420]|nr:phosphotransferase [Streptomyces sp. GC420]
MARRLAHPPHTAPDDSPNAAARPDPCAGASTVLADRADGVVVRHGDLVVKAHAPGTDTAALGIRLRVAANRRLTGILLPPRPPLAQERSLVTDLHGRPVSAWPYGTPVDPERPDAAPWEEAATLLARLHRVPADRIEGLPGPLPPMRGPAKAARAVARMRAACLARGPETHAVPDPERDARETPPRPGREQARPAPDPGAGPLHEVVRAVLRAWHALPPWARDESPGTAPAATARLCHGDLHLGQLVRHPAPDGPWLLIDVDDLGTGDPAWDLARPAAWFAAGLLAPEVWARFLGAYRAAGGPAVPAAGDPWPQLDVPARALTVQTAALAVARAAAEHRDLDEVERLMTDSCYRIAAQSPRSVPESRK